MFPAKKFYSEMTDPEKFECQVNRIIHTSIDDARCSLLYLTQDAVLIEALRREQMQQTPRITLIKILQAELRRRELTKAKKVWR